MTLILFNKAKVVFDTATQTPCGTVEYSAPEIFRDECYSKSVDLWALGCVLYTLLCGFPPFYGETVGIVASRVRQGKFQFLSPWWDTVSMEAKDLIKRLLEIDPKKRIDVKDLMRHPWLLGLPLSHMITSPVKHLYNRSVSPASSPALLPRPFRSAMKPGGYAESSVTSNGNAASFKPIPRPSMLPSGVIASNAGLTASSATTLVNSQSVCRSVDDANLSHVARLMISEQQASTAAIVSPSSKSSDSEKPEAIEAFESAAVVALPQAPRAPPPIDTANIPRNSHSGQNTTDSSVCSGLWPDLKDRVLKTPRDAHVSTESRITQAFDALSIQALCQEAVEITTVTPEPTRATTNIVPIPAVPRESPLIVNSVASSANMTAPLPLPSKNVTAIRNLLDLNWGPSSPASPVQLPKHLQQSIPPSVPNNTPASSFYGSYASTPCMTPAIPSAPPNSTCSTVASSLVVPSSLNSTSFDRIGSKLDDVSNILSNSSVANSMHHSTSSFSSRASSATVDGSTVITLPPVLTKKSANAPMDVYQEVFEMDDDGNANSLISSSPSTVGMPRAPNPSSFHVDTPVTNKVFTYSAQQQQLSSLITTKLNTLKQSQQHPSGSTWMKPPTPRMGSNCNSIVNRTNVVGSTYVACDGNAVNGGKSEPDADEHVPLGFNLDMSSSSLLLRRRRKKSENAVVIKSVASSE